MLQRIYLCLILVGSQYVGCMPETDYAQEAAWLSRRSDSAAGMDARMRCQLRGYKLEPSIGSCYKFNQVPRTWYQAYVACHEENGELVVINGEDEAQVLKEIFNKTMSSEQATIGFRNKEGEWLTIDGETLADAGFDSWAPGEPNNRKGDEMCGYFLRSGLLNDDPCDILLPYICEMEF